jgi:hypothetical protein
VTPDSPTKDDSTDARRANSLINRFFSLDVDLEYALQGGQYWLPYRQVAAKRSKTRAPICCSAAR